MKKQTLIVNLYAGPGTGKSTTCAGVFSELKWAGIDCEMATEFAKDKVWEKSFKTLECQPYIFGKQLHRISRLNGEVDVVITDSPVLLSLIYDKTKSVKFADFVVEEFNKFNNYNIFLHRKKAYNPNGRMQTENEAKDIDSKIKEMLIKYNIEFVDVVSSPHNVKHIAESIIKKIKS